MTLEEINNLKYIDIANELVNRILSLEGNNCEVKPDFILDDDYNKIVMLNDLEKPSEEDFLLELDKYKKELLVEYYNSIKRSTDPELTGEETVEELNNKIKDVELSTIVSLYDSLVFTKVEKPELSEDLSLTDIRKLIRDLHAEEARLIENDRREDLKRRIEAISEEYLHEAIVNAGYTHEPNLKLLKNVLIFGDSDRRPEFKDTAYAEKFIQDIEIAAGLVEAERVKQKAKKTRKEIGRQIRELTTNVIDTIIGLNVEHGLDVDAITFKFAGILSLLQKWQPNKAKLLIEQIQVDDTITQEMIDEILENYN